MRANISENCFLVYSDPTYARPLYGIEKNFDALGNHAWLGTNWTLSFYIISAYLAAILAGLRCMRHRPPFQLRGALFLWNAAQAGFNTVVAYRLLGALAYVVQRDGFEAALCAAGSAEHKQAFALWAWLFIMSKVVQLGDTAFIVLRKSPLLFLHWFHHATVLLLVWSTSGWPSVIYIWFAGINALVHAFVYTHFALRAVRVPIPRAASMAVTGLELVQLVAGMYITQYAYRAKLAKPDCCVYDQAFLVSACLYVALLALFGNFFVRTYITKKPLMAIVFEKKAN